MSVEADPGPANMLELPTSVLARLVQHVASGPGGLASAEMLSQTCWAFYDLSKSTAVLYRNLHLANPLNSLDHPFFWWLANRRGHISGLTAEIRLRRMGGWPPKPSPQQLRGLFGIPGLHLTLSCNEVIATRDHFFIIKTLTHYGHLIDHLISAICTSTVCFDLEELKLQDFCEAAAPCRSVDLTVGTSHVMPVNMVDLNPVAGSLVCLRLEPSARVELTANGELRTAAGKLESVSSLALLSQLTSLSLHRYHLGAEEPWIHLSGLTNLKQLSLGVAASGDPSPLSALTGLSFEVTQQ